MKFDSIHNSPYDLFTAQLSELEEMGYPAMKIHQEMKEDKEEKKDIRTVIRVPQLARMGTSIYIPV